VSSWLRMRSASSRYLRTAPRVAAAVSTSRWRAPTSCSARAQSIVSATPGGLSRSAGQPGVQDLDLALQVRVVEPEVEAAPLERVVHLARAVGGEDDQRGLLGPHLTDLGDRDGVLGEHLEEEGLELVVGAVDLVDQQHARAGLQRAQDGAGEQEARVVERGLDRVGVEGLPGGRRRRLQRAQVQELSREVPVVEGLGSVDAVVALQPDQVGAQHLGERLRQRGLARARLPLAEQRTVHLHGEERGRGESVVGQVAGGAQGRRQLRGRPRGVRGAFCHGSSMTERARTSHHW